MKEKITIEIGNSKNSIPSAGKGALTKTNTGSKKSAFKRIVLAFLNAIRQEEAKDSSAIAQLGIAVRKYRFGLAIIGLVFMLIFKNDETKANGLAENLKEEASVNSGNQNGKTVPVSENEKPLKKDSGTGSETKKNRNTDKGESLKAYHIPNIPDAQNRKRKHSDLGRNSEKAVSLYLKSYAKTASNEAEKLNIPASVMIGLALLNSDFGYSELALKSNNHFNIQCSENTVPMGKGMKSQLVRNDNCYTVYGSAWASFRAQAKMIEKILKKYSNKGDKNHFSVINILEQAGYFESRDFSSGDLNRIILDFNLSRFDN